MMASVIETVPVAELVMRGLQRDDNDLRPVVLVVDDERMIADTLTAVLRVAGFAAFTAYDGYSALELAEVIPPELLISDVVMPGMSGVELAMELTRLIPDCRTLLFSASASRAAVSDGFGSEFCLISKPVHPAEMLARISQLGFSARPTVQ